MPNAVRDLLISLGVVGEDTVEPYSPRVRDRDDISVFRCGKSGVIFLSTTDHVSLKYYENRRLETTHQTQAQSEANQMAIVKLNDGNVTFPKLDDAERRARDFGRYLESKNWLDVGACTGRLFDQMASKCHFVMGVEPNEALRLDAAARGHEMVRSLDDVPTGRRFDIVTLFHVLEHIVDPVATLRKIRGLLAPDGFVLVEVPHARDFLLETADCEAFRRFTLWSEHLVLHTRASLRAVLRAGGFDTLDIQGYQRYPLANHLFWLRYGQPGGHSKWGFLESGDLNRSWEALLNSLDQTDTLIALPHE